MLGFFVQKLPGVLGSCGYAGASLRDACFHGKVLELPETVRVTTGTCRDAGFPESGRGFETHVAGASQAKSVHTALARTRVANRWPAASRI